MPLLPRDIVLRNAASYTSFDAGRGRPFQCSFCTIINVQGRKSRYRRADDVETIVRANFAQGIRRFFVTDDNFARNIQSTDLVSQSPMIVPGNPCNIIDLQ